MEKTNNYPSCDKTSTISSTNAATELKQSIVHLIKCVACLVSAVKNVFIKHPLPIMLIVMFSLFIFHFVSVCKLRSSLDYSYKTDLALKKHIESLQRDSESCNYMISQRKFKRY